MALTGSTRTWYLPDALDTVRRTLNDAGTPSAPLSYDPWGTPEGGAVPPIFGFTGELQDVGAGLVDLRARWYTPGGGTFTSRDAFAGFARKPQSIAPYIYTQNDPVNYIDPTGNWRFAIEPDDVNYEEHILTENYYEDVWTNRYHGHIEYSIGRDGGDWPCYLQNIFRTLFPQKGGIYDKKVKKTNKGPWMAAFFNLDLLNSGSGEIFEVKPDYDWAIAQGEIQVNIDLLAIQAADRSGILKGDVPPMFNLGIPPGTEYNWNGTSWMLGHNFPARVLVGAPRPKSGGEAEYSIWAGLKAPGLIVYWYEQTEEQRRKYPKNKLRRPGLIRDPGYTPPQEEEDEEDKGSKKKKGGTLYEAYPFQQWPTSPIYLPTDPSIVGPGSVILVP